MQTAWDARSPIPWTTTKRPDPSGRLHPPVSRSATGRDTSVEELTEMVVAEYRKALEERHRSAS